MNMKPRKLFVVFIIILLATTLLFPKTEEQKYCEQFSGESISDKPSDNFTSCQTDLRCKVDQDNLTTKDTDQDVVLFMCIPEKETSPVTSSQKTSVFPK
ncbi:MAG: hypothetical protein V7749_07635 [Cocleimonas sp.]